MARIPSEIVDDIRTQANIVNIVSQYTTLKKSGRTHMAHCPFHEDRTPSFSISEDKQLFHCFSCGRGGNVFTFLSEMEGYSFPEAVVKVAEDIHYPLDPSYANQKYAPASTQETKYSKMLALYQEAAAYYHHLLINTETGRPALEYLLNRGLSLDTIKKFQLGYSPKQRHGLYLFLEAQNEEKESSDNYEELYEESGLFAESESEGKREYLDRFFNRVIFPIADQRGDVIAFSGRALEESQSPDFHVAKYMNSPETILFNKSQVLFNIHQARAAIRRTGEVFLFEGFMDVIAAWQAGVENSVATMGTSLTEQHLVALDRLTQQVILAFDGDNAGMQAIKRSLDEFQKNTPFKMQVVTFPSGQDPDDFIKARGDEAFKELLKHGRQTVMGFYMDYYRHDKNLSNENEQLAYITAVLTELTNVSSPVERELYINRLGEEFAISEDTLLAQFQEILEQVQSKQLKERRTKKKKEQQTVSIDLKEASDQVSMGELAQKMLLHRLFYSEKAWEILTQVAPSFAFKNVEYQELYLLYDAYRKRDQFNHVEGFIDFLQTSELQELATNIMWMNLGKVYTEQEMKDYIDVIEQTSPLAEDISSKNEALEQAKRRGDREEQVKIAWQIIRLNQKLKNKHTRGQTNE